jgi:Holliday junction DNA helicase RuvA
MFHHIEGEVVVLSPTRAVLDVGGVGYELSIPLSTFRVIQDQQRARLLVHFIVREDSQRLYGFNTEAERELFRMVVGINGVGPAIALAVLSTLDVDDFTRIVDSGDSAALRQIKGVGRKLADRMIIELRDRLPLVVPGLVGGGKPASPGSGGLLRSRFGPGPAGEATQALQELGFQPKEAVQRVERALAALTPSVESPAEPLDSVAAGAEPKNPSVEEILSRALRHD